MRIANAFAYLLHTTTIDIGTTVDSEMMEGCETAKDREATVGREIIVDIETIPVDSGTTVSKEIVDNRKTTVCTATTVASKQIYDL